MNIRLITTIEKIRNGYWFVPALMVVVAVALSFITVAIDHSLVDRWSGGSFGWLGSGDPDGARSFLSTVAGSMITIAGVTFSITMVALAQASAQFGPRVLTNFMRDRGNQIVLGTFIATFTYCLFVLRSVKSIVDGVFVPHVSILVGVALAIASVGVLVYFFHHITMLLRAEYIIEDVGAQLGIAVQHLYPEQLDYSRYMHQLQAEEDRPTELDMDDAYMITVSRRGYVQVIDIEGLVKLAEQQDGIMRLNYRPGDYVVEGSEIAALWSDDDPGDDVREQIAGAFVLGKQRLRMQDVEFPVHQLVEIAVRALSPGINDPFTAMACINQLSSGLAQLVERSIPAGFHYDDAGRLRLLTDALTFTDVLEAAFHQIRQHARGDVAVTLALLDAIATIATHTRTREQRVTLSRQAEMILRGSQDAVPEEWDRDDIKAHYEAAVHELSEQPDDEEGEEAENGASGTETAPESESESTDPGVVQNADFVS